MENKHSTNNDVENDLIKKIHNYFDIFVEEIENQTNYIKNERYEDIFCKVLNITEDLNMENLNRTKENHEAVDLGDYDKKIGYQITSEKKSKKIRSTIEKFEKFNCIKNFENLYFLILVFQTNYGNPNKSPDNYGLPNHRTYFDIKNIINLSDLLEKIKTLDIKEIKEIEFFLKEKIK